MTIEDLRHFVQRFRPMRVALALLLFGATAVMLSACDGDQRLIDRHQRALDEEDDAAHDTGGTDR